MKENGRERPAEHQIRTKQQKGKRTNVKGGEGSVLWTTREGGGKKNKQTKQKIEHDHARSGRIIDASKRKNINDMILEVALELDKIK